MTQEELNDILEKHKKWVNDEDGGERADLSFADLSDVNLSYANLCDVGLRGANLCGADLRNADLSFADLSDADLHKANLCGANLNHADLCFADLSNVDLCYTNLYRANLRGANLNCANLSFANLNKADLCYAENIPYIPMICPEEGSFIGWKKCRTFDNAWVIVKLQIPANAKRSSATSRKCRCDKAKVLGIYNLDGTKANVTKARSVFISKFEYEIGKMVFADSFDEDRWNGCSNGIHFFMNRQEAITFRL